MVSKKILAAGLLALSLLAALLPGPAAAQSSPQLIAPGGPYAVGRTAYDWVDAAREEVHTEEEGDRRELLVEVWYPADPAPDAKVGAYLEIPMAVLFAQMVEKPPENTISLQSNAYPDAPLSKAETTYPVVIFSPGFSVVPRRYTVLLEELASQGYVVFAVSHPYVTNLTIFPDGRLVEPMNYNRLASLWVPQNVYDGEFEGAWLPDLQFVLDQIEAINADDPQDRFTGRLDAAHVGMIGHSQGGRTVSEACMLDARCAGAVNLDGRRSAWVNLLMDKPYMLILSDDGGVRGLVDEFDYGLEALDSGYYVLMIPGTDHMSFVDDAFWLPLVFDADPPDELIVAQRVLIDYRAYILAFLNKHVRGLDVPLLDGPSEEYWEVFFFARTGDAPDPLAGHTPQPVVIGEDNRGELEVGTAHAWTYQGRAGEQITAWITADRPANLATHEERIQFELMDTLLVVRGPDGRILALNDDRLPGFTDSILEALELPVDGEYRIEVRTWGSLYAGGYSLMVESSRTPATF